MNKRDYFVKALAAGAHLHKAWVLEAFSHVAEMSNSVDKEPAYPYALARDEAGLYSAYTETGQWEAIATVEHGQALYTASEVMMLKKGELANLQQDVKTCYGDAFFNAFVLVYAFGDKVPFMNGRLKPDTLEAHILKRMIDDPKDGKPVPAEAITVSQYMKFGEAMYALAGFTQLFVPAATPKTMTTDPRMGELRARLLEENKDHLNDPVVISKIEAELVALDRAWIKGDPGEGFYLKDKAYTVIRKRMHGMYGAEDPFGTGTSVTLIEKSLNDGWDITKLPVMASSLREGSFGRGAETELGGATAKEINRYSTNSSITQEDCGTKIGLPTLITAENKASYLDNYVFVNGKEILTTEANIDTFVGQTIQVRSPVYCKTANTDYCVHCCGTKLAQTPNAIGSYCADIGSTFMLVAMSKMHGTALATARWDLNSRIL